ncbi:signal recognition particle protein [Chthoniobacter flavus Ellin428]|uniref:Signal recognition particle protein n=1 Tax=Chthoniobacter flavus Ellin428 TaxID=497964 RepID=B4D1X7_9BACT|nr:signal recognition particle protein [Chthoniobacter flavus]EDY19739.1 signal recognition particle protein [Chthoniobacter flavus Ellin428]TCO92974.1 signal recognition particle subunit FFH/SRP54 (srp54) [Chthoniobacter flavus]
MFSLLADKLQDVFKDLRGHGKITETNITDAMRAVRMALLEADVEFNVAKGFIARVKEKALGEEVLRGVHPGQQIVKIFHDELTALLGGDNEPLNLEKPARIMMVGLNGAGKTTSSAKLAMWLKKQGKAPLLIACDLHRPAAIEQLATLARQVGVPCFTPPPGEKDVLKVGRLAADWAKEQPGNVQIYDTAGRQEIDEPLIQEIKALREFLQPQEVLLVADAATGQQAVSVATHFHQALNITGLVLTKLDGDARGGAALSMRQVTQRPIKFAGIGEKLDQFEPFFPDRLAGRILGMGDIIGLVEKAAAAIDEEDAKRMEEKMRTASFDLNDFLAQFKMLKKLGPLENILGMLPGMSNLKDFSVDEKQMKRVEAIVLSMTLAERSNPDVLNARRRQRIARGSGVSVTEVNDLLQRFGQMRKMMKGFGKMRQMMSRPGAASRFGLKR